MKVALLTPGPVSDAGWSAMAYDGLQAIKTDLGAEVSNQEALDAKIPDAMRSYAQDGFKLIIGHGFEYNEPAVEIAADYPETFFVSSSGSETAPNVGVIRFYLEQGFYVAGAAAALSSKTGKLAMIGGPDVPSIRSTFKAFKAGAEAARPGVEVIEVFTGDGQDVAKAKQAALTAIGQGADFLIHQANAAAQGVFDAAKEKGVSAFGANLNQNDNASGSVVGSAIIEAKPAFLSLAKRVQEGSYKGEVSLFGMKDGAIKMVWNEALADRITPDAKAKAEALIAEIEAGTLEVPKDEF
ncbi:MAG: BMP family protein [Fimbriimonadaceae bacterium]|nr:BMP family protein [Fimbriimonadaceae bacterium]